MFHFKLSQIVCMRMLACACIYIKCHKHTTQHMHGIGTCEVTVGNEKAVKSFFLIIKWIYLNVTHFEQTPWLMPQIIPIIPLRKKKHQDFHAGDSCIMMQPLPSFFPLVTFSHPTLTNRHAQLRSLRNHPTSQIAVPTAASSANVITYAIPSTCWVLVGSQNNLFFFNFW